MTTAATMTVTFMVQGMLGIAGLFLVIFAIYTATLDRRERTYRVLADGEVLYTGLTKADAEWNAHDAERTNWYDSVKVERE